MGMFNHFITNVTRMVLELQHHLSIVDSTDPLNKMSISFRLTSTFG